jgi:hypothetical protein
MRILPGRVDCRCAVCAERFPEAAPTTLAVVIWGWEWIPVPDSDLNELPGYIAEWSRVNPYRFAEEVFGTEKISPEKGSAEHRVRAAKGQRPSKSIGKVLWEKGQPIEGVLKFTCPRCRASATFAVANIISAATAARRSEANAILLPLRKRR